MARFHVGPALRPGRHPLVPCIHAGGGGCSSGSRRAALLVPLVFLLGFVLTAWLDVLGPIPGLDPSRLGTPALQTNVVAAPPTATSATSVADDAAAATDAGLAHAGRVSPFSFDIAKILGGANASVYAAWMAGAPDDWPLTRLAIPGTHDTMTHGIDLVGFRCQNAPLDVQLLAGVRYLDVRARVQIQPRQAQDGADDGDDGSDARRASPLGIYHAHVYTGYEFADIAETVFAFLEAHPSEVVIMRLKEEALPINGSVSDPPGTSWGGSKARPREAAEEAATAAAAAAADAPPVSLFLQSLDNYRLHNPRTAAGLSKYLYRFNTTEDPSFRTPPPSSVPTMGALRGKILILQEFPYFPDSYLTAPRDAVPWYGIPWELSSALLQIEDYWQTPDLKHLDDKWRAVRENLQAAAKNATAAEQSKGTGSSGLPAPLFLSHLSASVGVTPIDAAAGPANRSVEGINDRTGRWLERGDDLADYAAPAEEAGGSKPRHYTPIGVAMADFPGKRLIDAILRRNTFLQFEE